MSVWTSSPEDWILKTNQICVQREQGLEEIYSFALKLNLTWNIVHDFWTTFCDWFVILLLDNPFTFSTLEKELWDIQNFTYFPQKEKVIQV